MQKREAGFSLVELLIVVAIIGIVSAIALPGLVQARKRANEASAIQLLRTVGAGEAAVIGSTGRAATLAELVASRAVDASVTDGSVHNFYHLSTVNVDLTTNDFEFSAVPEAASASNGDRSFNISTDGVVRFLEGFVAPVGTAGTAIGVTTP